VKKQDGTSIKGAKKNQKASVIAHSGSGEENKKGRECHYQEELKGVGGKRDVQKAGVGEEAEREGGAGQEAEVGHF